jgi:hypothetical protein
VFSNQQSAISFISLTLLSVPPTIGPVQTQATSIEARPIGRAAICLFAAVVFVDLLLARGHVTSGDEWHVYGTTESLVERGSWEVKVPGFNRKYSRYSPLPSLLGSPLHWMARPIADAAHRNVLSNSGVALRQPVVERAVRVRREILQAAVGCQSSLVTAATAAVLFWGLIRLGVSRGAALATACVFAFGTMALPYSGSMFTQPMAALAMACLVMTAANGLSRWVGVSLFFLLAVRSEFVALLPVLLVFQWRFLACNITHVASIVAGAAAGVGFNIVVNWLRGDHLLLSDYGSEGFTTPIWIGLQGVLLSPGKGLLWFAPAAAIGLALLAWLWRKAPRVGFLAIGVSATCLVLVACWWTWHGARSWGPRLLLPMMPVVVLPLAWVFHDWTQIAAARRWLLVGAIGVSVAVQVWGTLRNPVSEGVLIMPPVAANENEAIYIPQTGPWGVESQDFPDLLLWRLGVNEPSWRGSVIVIAIALAAGAVVAAWLACRACSLPVDWFRAAMPPVRMRPVAAIAGAIAIVALPEWAIVVLTRATETAEATLEPGIDRQFRRFAPAPSADAWNGKLLVPLTGEYIFYAQSPLPFRCFLDDRPIFRPSAENQAPGFVSLKAGPHRMRIERADPASNVTVYWTTPGLAYYKSPIPPLYLMGPNVTWQDRLAINLAHSKWVAWLAAIVLVLAVFAGSTRSSNDAPRVKQTLAPKENA